MCRRRADGGKRIAGTILILLLMWDRATTGMDARFPHSEPGVAAPPRLAASSVTSGRSLSSRVDAAASDPVPARASFSIPPEIESLLDRRRIEFSDCADSPHAGACRFRSKLGTARELVESKSRLGDLEVGWFALGRSYQYAPTVYAWTSSGPPVGRTPAADSPPKRPAPFKPLWQDQDWSYLDEPGNRTIDFFDFTKRNRIGDEIVFDVSGEFRWQGRVEDNRRLTGEQNDFNLFRERLALDIRYFGRIRTYLDVFWADASRQSVPPIFFDINHGDMLNAFGEISFDDVAEGRLSFRMGGREQLSFGNQRLVSTLDWANSPRTFDTVPHLLYRSDDLAFDAFWSQPNRVLARELDRAEGDLQFFGAYATYSGLEGRLFDLYYLGLLDTGGKLEANGRSGDADIHTIGTRWQVDRDGRLAEIETAYQFGTRVGTPINAGMATAGVGRRWAKAFCAPELWFYFDYASGNPTPDGPSYQTFHQLFPLGHKYLGYMDLVGRQNILDANVFLKFSFDTRVTFLIWYHDFHLASARDALYNGAGVPIRRDESGRAGRYVGNELDLLLVLVLNPHSDVQIGISNFFAGTFVERTSRTSSEAQGGTFFYTQFSYRF
ncbi:MAG: alginate export family protein [Isosphaeraceae bacterium]|nr:alginate export family protein [Isosphaeraceae bacterium]